MADVEILQDNTDEALQAMEEGIERALEAVGIQCENYAKGLCPQDTGLLRNSITHARGGISTSGMYHGDKPSKYSKVQAVPIGYHNMSMPSDSGGTKSVYIGTNVEYGIYVHEGHKQRNGDQVPARRFLRDAAVNNMEKYRRIFEDAIRDALR